jgi:hypothetical protein
VDSDTYRNEGPAQRCGCLQGVNCGCEEHVAMDASSLNDPTERAGQIIQALEVELAAVRAELARQVAGRAIEQEALRNALAMLAQSRL